MYKKVYKRWGKRLKEFDSSGLSLQEYCSQNNLNIRTAMLWQKRLQLQGNILSSEKNDNDTELEIIKVHLKDDSPHVIDSGVSLSIGELRIFLNEDFNLLALKKVLSLLEV